jgi:hypothetical protein
MEAQATYYFQGNGRRSADETLALLDIDCQKTAGLGSPEGALWFAARLAEEHFPGLVHEPSTHGAGRHAYLVVRKSGHGARAVNARLRGLERWLRQLALEWGADIENIEVKGACPRFEWQDGKKLVNVVAGTFGKLPRVDVRGTTRIDLADLPRPAPTGGSPPPRRARAFPAGSWSPLAVPPADLANLPRLAAVATRLDLPAGHGPAAVTVEDVAVYLLLLLNFSRRPNADGSLPSAWFKGLWKALYQAGDVGRAFHDGRFARITEHLSRLGLLEWRDGTFAKGRARKWGASQDLLSLIAPGNLP